MQHTRHRVLNNAQSFFQIHVIFTIIGLIFGLYFVHAIPLFWGYDETQHFARAYQVSDGQLKPLKTGNNYGGKLPSSLDQLMDKTERDLQDNTGGPFYERRDITDARLYGSEASKDFSKQKTVRIFNGSAVYSPVAYAPAVEGIKISQALGLNMRNTVLLARTFMLVSYILLVAAGLYFLRSHRARYLVFVIALLPMALAQAAVVSADVLANGLGLLLFSMLLYAYSNRMRVTNGQYAAIALIVIILPLVKLNYLFLCLPALFIKPPFKLQRVNTQSLYFRAMLALAALVPVIVWYIATRDVASHVVSAIPGLQDAVDPLKQLSFVLSHPIQFLIAFVSTFARFGDEFVYGLGSSIGWNYVGLPLFGLVIISALLGVAFMHAKEIRPTHTKHLAHTVFLIGGVVAALSIFATLYLTFTPIGKNVIQGVQGRYFIPVIPFVLYGLARYVPFDMKESSQNRSLLVFSVGMAFVLLMAAVWYFLSTY